MAYTKPNGVHITPNPNGFGSKKTFIPLENNPTVFTSLVHTLGLSPQLSFHDIYDLSSPAFHSHIPRPIHALIFISPASIYHAVRASGPGGKELKYTGSGPDEPVFWLKQTIGHACGLVALIHSIANGSARAFVRPDSLMANLLEESESLTALPRAGVFYDSQELEDAHMAAAVQGDSKAPASREPNGYHFICFVKGGDGRLWELEGGWEGPIERGVLGMGEDLLGEKAIGLGVGRYLEVARRTGECEFSMIALAGE